MTDKIRLGFIGAGALATMLAVEFKKHGFTVASVSSRGYESARMLATRLDGCHAARDNQQVADNADMVFIATPDDVIHVVASQVCWRKGQMVVHCSGADSVDILNPAKTAGCRTGVFHPLQTFAAGLEDNLKGITCAIEAEEPLLAQLKDMAQILGGHWIELKSKDRVIYHAAAVFACNYLVTLTDIAAGLWEDIDISRDKAVRALLPLMRGTLNNIEAIGITQSLTGPIARGDSGTINKHIAALDKINPDITKLYRELGLNTIPIAMEKGKLNVSHAKEIAGILEHSIQ